MAGSLGCRTHSVSAEYRKRAYHASQGYDMAKRFILSRRARSPFTIYGGTTWVEPDCTLASVMEG